MKANFAAALALVLGVEKGFVDNPHDPGGATNLGVTQATFDKWRNLQGVPLQSVALTTADEAAKIYKANYWDAVGGDTRPGGVDYCLFDFAVNSGPGRALKFLAHVLYGHPDKAGDADPALLCFALCLSRMRFMEGADWSDFGKGWASRVVTVLYQSLRLCSNTASHT